MPNNQQKKKSLKVKSSFNTWTSLQMYVLHQEAHVGMKERQKHFPHNSTSNILAPCKIKGW